VVAIAPSLLAADLLHLGEEVRAAAQAGADRLHLDIMDGRFVPNISFGPAVVEAVRQVTELPLEAHLMIEEPHRYVDTFVAAGATTVQVHVENTPHLHRTVAHIKDLGARAGVVLNPATPVEAIGEILPDVDMVLVMTVNPGFGGQRFIASTTGKIRRLAELIAARHPRCELEVDGGIDGESAPLAVAAGATVLVAGTAVFRAPGGIAAGLAALAQAAQRFTGALPRKEKGCPVPR